MLILAVLLLIAFLAACGNSDNEELGTEDSEKGDEYWENIQKSGELVVGTSGTLIAASYYEGEDETEEQLTGYEVETMREIAKRLDLDISFEIIGVDSVMTAINNGRIDISTGAITDNRKEKFDYSDPIKYSYITMAVRKDGNSGIETLEDLKGKKAGGGATTIYS